MKEDEKSAEMSWDSNLMIDPDKLVAPIQKSKKAEAPAVFTPPSGNCLLQLKDY